MSGYLGVTTRSAQAIYWSKAVLWSALSIRLLYFIIEYQFTAAITCQGVFSPYIHPGSSILGVHSLSTPESVQLWVHTLFYALPRMTDFTFKLDILGVSSGYEQLIVSSVFVWLCVSPLWQQSISPVLMGMCVALIMLSSFNLITPEWALPNIYEQPSKSPELTVMTGGLFMQSINLVLSIKFLAVLLFYLIVELSASSYMLSINISIVLFLCNENNLLTLSISLFLFLIPHMSKITQYLTLSDLLHFA